jgi:hypothetical protein
MREDPCLTLIFFMLSLLILCNCLNLMRRWRDSFWQRNDNLAFSIASDCVYGLLLFDFSNSPAAYATDK